MPRLHPMSPVLAVLALLVLAGCPVDVTPDGAGTVRWLCVTDDDCGDGWTCSASNICLAPGTVDGGDGFTPGGGGGTGGANDGVATLVVPDYTATDDETGHVVLDGTRHAIYAILDFSNGDDPDTVGLLNGCTTHTFISVEFGAPRSSGGQPTGYVLLNTENDGSYASSAVEFQLEQTDAGDFWVASGEAPRMDRVDPTTLSWSVRFSTTAEASATIHKPEDLPGQVQYGEALLRGVIAPSSEAKFRHLLDNLEEVNTLVFECWHGWQGDVLVRDIGRSIRAAGLNTKLVRGGVVRAGFLFAAGNARLLEDGATFIDGTVEKDAGVRFIVSTYGKDGQSADEFACPASSWHAEFLSYLGECLGTYRGELFYCDSVQHTADYFLTTDEVLDYELITGSAP